MDFAVLVDPERDEPFVPIGDHDVLFSTAGLEPRWVVDLDGDANDELVVRYRVGRRRREDLVLLRADGDAYAQHDLWSKITP